MDIGVGGFLFSGAVVAKQPRKISMKRIKAVLELLCLGFFRYFVLTAVNYQVLVS